MRKFKKQMSRKRPLLFEFPPHFHNGKYPPRNKGLHNQKGVYQWQLPDNSKYIGNRKQAERGIHL